MNPADCNKCSKGQFLCPSDQKTCVDGAEAYVKCPGMKGTHFDWTLSIEQRIDYLIAHTNVTTQIKQLTNGAPGIPDMGVRLPQHPITTSQLGPCSP